MANFVKKTWFDGPDGGTPITAAELNRLEEGVETAIAAASVSVKTETGTTVNVVASDTGSLLDLSSDSPVRVVLPSDAEPFSPGDQVHFLGSGDGPVTFVPGDGAFVDGTPSLQLRDKWSAATAIKRAASSSWVVIGDLATLEPPSTVRVNGFSWYERGAAVPDTYWAIDAEGADLEELDGNTGWDRQNLGTPVCPFPQSMMRRCVLRNDGSGVNYYLDADNSDIKAGAWLRIHEGSYDPVSGTPNIPVGERTGSATLRRDVEEWDSTTPYTPGARVLHDGKLWEALEPSNGTEPAPTLLSADLTGVDGQVMVEIPRFYVAYEYERTKLYRHSWDIATDPPEVRPYPDLLDDGSGLPTEKIIDGRTFTVHPAFIKAGVQRSHRYIAAYRAKIVSNVLVSTKGGVYGSDFTRDQARTYARNRNSGLIDPSGVANNVWHQVDWDLWEAIQILYLTEYRTFYSQAVLGSGNSLGAHYAKTCGRSNPVGNGSGQYDSSGTLTTVSATVASDGLAYRGIEDFYGSMYMFVDGWNVNNLQHYVCSNPAEFADDTTTNYVLVGGASSSNGFVSSIGPRFIPTAATGSSTTFLTNRYYPGTGWRIVRVGGAAYNVAAGAFLVNASNTALQTFSDFGGALAR